MNYLTGTHFYSQRKKQNALFWETGGVTPEKYDIAQVALNRCCALCRPVGSCIARRRELALQRSMRRLTAGA